MAAPGAIVISIMPSPQLEAIDNEIHISQEKIGSNILESIANGTTEGLKLALNIGAMLLVFLAFIAMINGILGWVGELTTINNWVASNTSYKEFSLEFVLGSFWHPFCMMFITSLLNSMKIIKHFCFVPWLFCFTYLDVRPPGPNCDRIELPCLPFESRGRGPVW